MVELRDKGTVWGGGSGGREVPTLSMTKTKSWGITSVALKTDDIQVFGITCCFSFYFEISLTHINKYSIYVFYFIKIHICI